MTGYLPYYHMSAHELAMTMVREVLHNTGITATAGIGPNLYLAKLAMDIVAKHIPADKDGVRIAELDEQMCIRDSLYPKAWVRKEDGFYLYKDGGREAVEREVLASKICRCFDCHQVLYEPVSYTHIDVYKRQE